MWLRVMDSDFKLDKVVQNSLSYVDKNGNHPNIGDCFSPKYVVFIDGVNIKDNSDIEDDQWLFIIDNLTFKEQIIDLGSFYDEAIIICE